MLKLVKFFTFFKLYYIGLFTGTRLASFHAVTSYVSRRELEKSGFSYW